MSSTDQLGTDVLNCVDNCIRLLRNTEGVLDIIITRLESAESAIVALSTFRSAPWADLVLAKIQQVINLLNSSISEDVAWTRERGRPKITLPFEHVEYFLSLSFKATQIAKMFGVSVSTIQRILGENNASVRKSYSDISDEELCSTVVGILRNQPNTGYKRMKGHLLQRGVKVTYQRVREIMRTADPSGVYERTMAKNYQIRRRTYYVKYSNQMWHLDGNHKLIRWGIVVRGAIDGKSRTVTYMEASNNNRADTHLQSFLNGVQRFGVPLRTRSDKGKENIQIASFMIQSRGTGRSSHICGRSIHNQRIERLWRDLFYGCISTYYSLFTCLEDDGLLELDNQKHIELIHLIFLPRLNHHLDEFRNGWNHHPISSENNQTPTQLMVLNLPPENWDMELSEVDLIDAEFSCNSYDDLTSFDEESIVNPNPPSGTLTQAELAIVSSLDIFRDSDSFGYDIFENAIDILKNGVNTTEILTTL